LDELSMEIGSDLTSLFCSRPLHSISQFNSQFTQFDPNIFTVPLQPATLKFAQFDPDPT